MELDHSNLLNEFEDFGLTPNLKVLIKCKCVFLNLSWWFIMILDLSVVEVILFEWIMP
jgi:hypothetical protein